MGLLIGFVVFVAFANGAYNFARWWERTEEP